MKPENNMTHFQEKLTAALAVSDYELIKLIEPERLLKIVHLENKVYIISYQAMIIGNVHNAIMLLKITHCS